VTLGVTEFKFCRPSALIDPLDGKEWVPVRARDPRLMPALQAYAAANLTTIPPVYMLLAGPPTRTHILGANNLGLGGSGQGTFGTGSGQIGAGQGGQSFGSGQGIGSGQTGQGGLPGGQTGQPGVGQQRTRQADDDDDDDDDDTSVVDPLAGMLKGDPSNLPIVGVAPNLKGASVHSLWGLNRYEDWVFIYVPPQPVQQIGIPQNGLPQSGQPLQPLQPGQGQNPPLRISP
ncbi:MAG: hypothetical protein ACREAC_24030, partial [Blastocatellia bacterium]